jgi:tetratricopeptide (TPR) repeat protein
MSEILYEQYKEALRQGHVAALRGRLDAAAAAYRNAARIAPDRALPYVGLGGVLSRLGRSDEALAAYAAALDRTPTDEGAMRGRADVLAATGRRAEAADTLDRLAATLEREGRMADACDVARRALELAESRGRRKQVESLVARLRSATGDASAAEALERALGVLDSVPGVLTRRGDDASEDGALEPGADGGPREPAVPKLPDPTLLTLAVEEALETGDLDEARRRALVAAIGHRAVGQFHAAMDACYQALAIMPSDPDIHLLLAELYLDRGWRGPAADKLVLLGRLSLLTGDDATRARLCYLAAARFPDDPRLAAVCG